MDLKGQPTAVHQKRCCLFSLKFIYGSMLHRLLVNCSFHMYLLHF
jgi:hypothetical protein